MTAKTSRKQRRAYQLRAYRVSDTIHVRRSWTVLAISEQAAINHALDHGPTKEDYEEDQLDAEPYEAEVLPTARLHDVQVGERVYWHDPDAGSCSGAGVVVDVAVEAGEPVTEETIIRLLKDDGGEVEAVLRELSELN